MSYPRRIHKACYDNDVVVCLTKPENEYCMEFGLRIRQDSILRGAVNRLRDQDAPEWQQLLRQQEGYVCEGVVWKAGGKSPIGRLRAFNYSDGLPDVGLNIEVKQITEEDYCLPIPKEVPGSRMVVGVVLVHCRDARAGIYRIPGYYPAWMARKHPEWLLAGSEDYYIIPQKELFPFPWIQHLVQD
jgi:hypothetical protein